ANGCRFPADVTQYAIERGVTSYREAASWVGVKVPGFKPPKNLMVHPIWVRDRKTRQRTKIIQPILREADALFEAINGFIFTTTIDRRNMMDGVGHWEEAKPILNVKRLCECPDDYSAPRALLTKGKERGSHSIRWKKGVGAFIYYALRARYRDRFDCEF